MAKRVKFLKDRDVPIDGQSLKAYKKGTEDTLTDAQAAEVLAEEGGDGSAELVSDRTPGRRKAD